MRFYAGLTAEEIGGVMGLSTRTIERHWQYARTWLFRKITKNELPERADAMSARVDSLKSN